MSIQGPEIPRWFVRFVEWLPEPGPKAVETLYGLMIWTLAVQVVTTVMAALLGAR